MEMLKDTILQALEDRYNAQISEAEATLKIYFENSVGIGEHPQHLEECDKLINKIAEAEDKLAVIKEFKEWVFNKNELVKNQKDQEEGYIQMKIQEILLGLNLLRQQMQEKLWLKLKNLKNRLQEKFKF